MHSRPTSRPIVATVSLWILPVLFLLDTALAAWGRWRPVGQVEYGLLTAFSLWLLTGFLALYPRTRFALGIRWREIVLLALSTGLSWLCLELGAHLAESHMRPTAPHHTRGENLHNIHHPDPTHIRGITGPSHFTTGPNCVRAQTTPEPAQDIRILAIGGSTTECVYLDDSETWPALSQERVTKTRGIEDVWIGNVGISGFYTKDHIRFVADSPLMKGTNVLIVQPGINDLWRFLAGEEDHTNFVRFEGSAGIGSPDVAESPQPYRPVWTRSRVIQLFHTLRADPPPPEAQEGVGGAEYAIRREKRATADVTAELPDLTEGVRAYRQRILTMIERARSRNIALLFTTQPVLWRSDLPSEEAAQCWFGWLEDERYLTLGALRSAMDLYNAALLDVCAEANVPCVDLSSMNGKSAWFYDDCHFTEAGAEEVARLVSPGLAQLLGQPPVD
jgi:lysophospholipase L1-like esterase